MPSARAVRALRGATTVDATPIAESAREATHELLGLLLGENRLSPDDIVSALFTLTPDLYGAAPARAAREIGWDEVPMLTASEAPSERALPHCIRVLLHVETSRPRREMRHVYLRGARVLRPDLVDDLPPTSHQRG